MYPLFLRIKVALVTLLLFMTISLTAQTVLNMSEVNEMYRRAVELYQKKLYALAQSEFERVLSLGLNQDGAVFSIAAQYYLLECAYEQWSPATEMLIKLFIEKYPESARQNDAQYLLAKYYYREGNYEKALEAYTAFDASTLSSSDYQEYAFKKAYCLFMTKKYDEASPLFSLVKDGDSKYAAASTYYYSHIAYEQHRYAVALNGFENLRDDDVFSRLVPYYIMHIYYSQKNYDKVIAEGVELMDKATSKRLPEVAHMLGEAYYHKQQYAEALPYFEKYMETAPALTRSDKYMLGYIYYQNKDFPKAASMFEQIVVGQDSLAQSAYYYLADAFMKQGDKQNAGRAFLQASKMDFFPEIKEDALFSYAKLMFEMNSGPFSDAIDALNMYLAAYPNSRRSDEVNKCLMQAYVYSKNYKAALASLQAIAKPDADALAAMQKVAYFRAVELFQNQDYNESTQLFDLSLKYASYDAVTAALASYWKAEATYRLNNFVLAQKLFNEVVLMPGISQREEYKMAHYGLGYSLLKQARYADALGWFRKYIAMNTTPNAMLCDAYNRIGDCYFMMSSYEQAIESYKEVMNLNIANVDYAALQRGLCYGLLAQPEKKIEQMNVVINFRPASLYADYALYEKGRCYVQMQQYDQAVNVYVQLLNDHQQSGYYAKALVELGLIYVNKGDNAKALAYYKRAIDEFPGTAEARSALLGVKNIYVEQGDVESYFKYMSGIKSFAAISPSEKDSMSFSVAERAYTSNDCEKTISSTQKYLKDFASGAFLIDANYYLADCYYRTGQLEEAMPHFAYVINNPKNAYTEAALQGAARGAFEQGSNAQASEYFERLQKVASTKATLVEAMVGKLRADDLMSDNSAVVADATMLLSTDNLPLELIREAYFKRAKAYEKLGLTDSAVNDYMVLAKNVKLAEGAEAQYKILEALFTKGDYDLLEQEVFNFSKSGTSHQYWLAKSFVLLGDVYVKRDDAFQAKATYESILDGYTITNDGIVDEVTQRLQQLVEAEKQKEDKAAQQASQEEISL